MWQFLSDINNNGTTIILTTHYLEEAENLCRNVAIIDDGLIIEDTLMSNLLRQLKQETFVLNIDEKLTKNLNLAQYNFTIRDENTLEVVIDSGHGINELFDLLNSQNIRVTSLRNKSNRLEELFMKLIDAKNLSMKDSL